MPNPAGKCDLAILTVLIGCGLRPPLLRPLVLEAAMGRDQDHRTEASFHERPLFGADVRI